jgi:hypothetical protein
MHFVTSIQHFFLYTKRVLSRVLSKENKGRLRNSFHTFVYPGFKPQTGTLMFCIKTREQTVCLKATTTNAVYASFPESDFKKRFKIIAHGIYKSITCCATRFSNYIKA